MASQVKASMRRMHVVRAAIGIGAVMLTAAALWLIVFDRHICTKWDRARVSMGEITKALNLYAHRHDGRYPTSLDGVAGDFTGGNVPPDPFTRAPFQYTKTADGFELLCLGKDRAPGGGEPPDADIRFTQEGESR